MGGYLWIDGGVSGAENEFSNIAFTSITKCFKASSTEVRYGLRIANAILHGIIRLKSIQVSKMSSKTYSCQTSHLRNQCIHYDKCTAASTGIPTPLASDQDALSLCLLRNQWKNETEIGVEVADLTTSEAVNALKSLIVDKLNALGGEFLLTDTTATLTHACPSVVASKIYYVDASATTTSSAGLQEETFLEDQFSVQEFIVDIISEPTFTSTSVETLWAQVNPNIYRGVNISSCAKINVTISAAAAETVSWHLVPFPLQADYKTVKYGHDVGHYGAGGLFATHKYCIPHGTYRFVARSTVTSGWGTTGSFSVACQQFKNLGGTTILTPQLMQAVINQENLFSTSFCKQLTDNYLYGTKSRDGVWKPVDTKVKEAIDASGVYNTILLERHQDYKDLGGVSFTISPSVPADFVLSFEPPIMFGPDGFTVMSVTTLEEPMRLQRKLPGKKYFGVFYWRC